jgi:hypothetical protein
MLKANILPYFTKTVFEGVLWLYLTHIMKSERKSNATGAIRSGGDHDMLCEWSLL